MKKSLLCLIIAAATGLRPAAAGAADPMTETALRAMTGQAAKASAKGTDELLQAYYDALYETNRHFPDGTDGALSNGAELGELGALNWAYRMLRHNTTSRASLLAAIRRFNTPNTNGMHPIHSVIMDIPRVVILSPRSSSTVVLSTTAGADDEKIFCAVTREASLMALHHGVIEIQVNR